jgi:hypothetical protein
MAVIGAVFGLTVIAYGSNWAGGADVPPIGMTAVELAPVVAGGKTPPVGVELHEVPGVVG